jgi:hypothetical protein
MERSHPSSGRSATPADINRNGRPTSIGTGGRHQSECPADIIRIHTQLESDMTNSAPPHAVLAERLLRAVQGLESRRSEFDVLFIYVGFTGGSLDDFDLHDHIKAATAARRLPVQLLREDKALAYRDRASVM